jgi:hypothetical protein
MNLSPATLLKAVGVILFTVVFWHLWNIPWCLVAGAALAMIVLP